MKYRSLKWCDWDLSEIGFGAWGIGGGLWKGGTDEEALKALHRASDLGLNFIDTALAYGQGHSEQLVGALLKEYPSVASAGATGGPATASRSPLQRSRLFVATKIPPKNQEWPARKRVPLNEVFPADHIISCTEKSLKNLGVEQIDLQQLHVWSENWVDDPSWHETLLRLKREGKIAHFGISINDHEPESALEVVRRGWVDSVQVVYNIFDPTPSEKLFPLCLEKNVGVIARCPFDEGALTGAITCETHFAEGDWRERYFTKERKKEIVARIEKLKGLLKEAGVQTLSELALRFCLSHPAVSVVIPGMRTVAHVNQNLMISDGTLLSDEIRNRLAAHAWPRNFYD
jgi:aryl-alcohol dehydrogenase-like predicted oxidoreductase